MKVRGTQEVVDNLEIGTTTVYLRSNIKRIETEDFTGWEYDEEQFSKENFIALLKTENTLLAAQNKVNSDRSDFLEELIVEMAMVVYP